MDVVSPASVPPDVSWQGKLLDDKGELSAAGDVAIAGVDISIWPLATAARPDAAARTLEKPIVFRE